jgi:hypothetical protein
VAKNLDVKGIFPGYQYGKRAMIQNAASGTTKVDTKTAKAAAAQPAEGGGLGLVALGLIALKLLALK